MDQDAASRSAPLRVLLVGCTGVLGGIIDRAVAEQPDLDVVGRVDVPGEDLAGADLVVWNNADESKVAAWLTAMWRPPRVVATVGDGRGASLWELLPSRTDLGALSPASLVDAIRMARRDTA